VANGLSNNLSFTKFWSNFKGLAVSFFEQILKSQKTRFFCTFVSKSCRENCYSCNLTKSCIYHLPPLTYKIKNQTYSFEHFARECMYVADFVVIIYHPSLSFDNNLQFYLMKRHCLLIYVITALLDSAFISMHSILFLQFKFIFYTLLFLIIMLFLLFSTIRKYPESEVIKNNVTSQRLSLTIGHLISSSKMSKGF